MSHWESQGASDEWFTPARVFDALGCTFDLDVATSCSPHVRVPARGQIFSRSLESQWQGFIWMNPPFGGRNGLAPWLERFFDHGDGIALTPDRTSAPWFQDAWLCADLAMFTPKLRFIRPDGSEGRSPSNGTCLWAAGPQACAALARAARAGLGILALPTGAPA